MDFVLKRRMLNLFLLIYAVTILGLLLIFQQDFLNFASPAERKPFEILPVPFSFSQHASPIGRPTSMFRQSPSRTGFVNEASFSIHPRVAVLQADLNVGIHGASKASPAGVIWIALLVN